MRSRFLSGASAIALLAVPMVLVSVDALAAAATLTGDATWASAGTQAQAVNDGTDAAANDTVDLSSHTLTVTNNGTANDGSIDVNTFALGAVTATGGGTLATTTPAAAAGDLSVTIGSIAGATNLNVSIANNANKNNATSVTGTTGVGTVNVTNSEATNASKTVTLTLNGALTATTGVNVTGGTATGSAATLVLGAAGANALVAATLTDNTGGATLKVSNAAAQTFSGTIDGGAANNGTLLVLNTHTNGASFAGKVGTTTQALNAITVGDATSAGFANFADTVSARTISVNATNANSTAKFSAATTAGTGGFVLTDGGNTATLSFDNSGAGYTVAGAIGGNTGGSGTLGIAGNATSGNAVVFSGNVGSTKLAAINVGVNGTSGGYAKFQGAMNATTTNLNTQTGNATVELASSSAQTVNAIDKTNAGNTGTVAVSGTGKVTFAGELGATNKVTMTIANGSSAELGGQTASKADITVGTGTSGTLSVGSNASFAGGLTLGAGSTLALGTSTLTQTGVNDLTLNAGAKITNTVAGSYAASGHMVTADAVDLTNGIVVAPTVATGINIRNGEKFILIDGTGAGTAGTVTVNNDNMGNKLVTWTAALGTSGTDRYGNNLDNSDLVLTATVHSVTTVSGVTSSIAGAADTIATYNGSNTNMVTLARNLQDLSSTAEIKKASEQLAPAETSGASTQGAMQATTQVLNVVGSRSEQVRTAQSGMSGVASGEAQKGLGLWGQMFGFLGDQDSKNGINGYEATTFGGAMGIDFKVADAVRLGVAGSYGNTNVDGKDSTAENDTNIDSYQLTFYGSYEGKPWYVNGALAASLHKYDTTRVVQFGGINDRVTGSHDGWQGTAKIDAGYPIIVGKSVLTPVAGVTYSHLEQDGYTESGTSGAPLTVESSSNNSVKSSLGAKASHTFIADNSKVTPEVRASWVHEYNNDAITTTSAYAGGGSSFTTTGLKPGADAAVLGLGLSIVTVNNLTVSANYDAELREGFTGHTGVLQLRTDF